MRAHCSGLLKQNDLNAEYHPNENSLERFAGVVSVPKSRPFLKGDFLQRSSSKYILLGLWLALVIAVSLAIYFQDRFVLIENRYVAFLADRNGPVLARSEGSVRWRDLNDKQGIHDGDTVSTGSSSSARLRFDIDRAVYVGEDTQLTITAIGSDKGTAFVLKLVRGSVVPQISDNCSQCAPLILRAGDESFTISAGKKVAVFKAQGSKEIKRFQPKSIVANTDFQAIVAALKPAIAEVAPPPSPPISAEVTIAKAFLQPEAVPRPAPRLAPAPVRLPPPPPAQVQPPVLSVIEPVKMETKAALNGAEFWTMRPFLSILDQFIEFPVAIPENVRADSSLTLRPFVEISGNGKSLQIFANNSTESAVKVSLKSIEKVSSVRVSGALKKYIFNSRTGVVVERGTTNSKFLSDGSVDTQVVSLGEVPAGQLNVGLSDFNPQAESPGSVWITKKEEIDLKDANTAIYITKSSDYDKLAPLVRGAAKLALDRQSPIGSDGIFVVRGDEIVAQIFGPATNKQKIDKIMMLLGGEFVFKGQRASYRNIQSIAQGKSEDPLWSLINQGHVLYILKRGTLYPVSREFLKSSAEVSAFVGKHAQAVFVKKVEILSHK